MRPIRNKRPPQALLAILGVVVLTLGAAAAAQALVTVYSNGFGSKAQYREIDRVGGGDRACSRSYARKAKRMRAGVSGKKHCQYAPPVQGDGARPDHDVVVEGKVLKGISRRAKKAAYLSLTVRLGRGESYELQVRPKTKRFKLIRNPDGAEFPVGDRNREIGGIGKRNKMRLRADGARITAFVNGERLASVTDPDAQDFRGDRMAFGLGSRRGIGNGPKATFDNVRVRVPNP